MRTPDLQLFHDVFSASPIGIVVENVDGQPLFANPAFCAFLGFTEEELHSKHCVDFSPPEDAGRDWVLFQQLRAGSIGHYQLEKRYFRRDGSLVWGRLSISLLNGRPSPLVLAMVEDITDKKNAEEARFRLAAVVESSDDAIASVTLDGIIVSWNAGAQKIYGYTEAEALGKPIDMLVPPEQPDEEKKILETLRTGGRIQHFETIRLTKTGKRINVSLTISPIQDSSGRTVGCSGIARDISERKRGEAAVRAGEELMKIFIKHVPAAVAMLDREMRYLQISERWCTDYLRGRAQILGRSHYDVFPDMPERWKEIHLRALQGETLRADEDRWDGQDGPHWAHWEVRPWKTPEGTVGGILILTEDITHRKHMEEALRESEDKLRLILDSTAEAIYGIDLEHRCTFCNPAGLRILGYERLDQVLGKNMHDLIHHTRADGTSFPVEQCGVHSLTTGEGVHAEDEMFWRANGTSFQAEYWSCPQRRGQEIVGAVVAFVDITDRKLAEAALAGVSRKLLEAEEKERARIARELHDDINQRLAMLAVELERLEGNPSEVRSGLEELRKRTTEISDDVQALSHELHSSKLEYLGAVRGINSWCKEFGERQGIQIDFKGPEAMSLPSEIGLCLFRVVQEALHNAAKHSGVRRIEVQLREDSGQIHLLVSDLGRGFELETAMDGHGLGLTSMKERVRLVNGIIEIQSKPMGGTTVHVRVPLNRESDSIRAAG